VLYAPTAILLPRSIKDATKVTEDFQDDRDI
jgi:hypothetical protein